MPVPDQVRDDGSGIQNILELLDSGFRRNDNNFKISCRGGGYPLPEKIVMAKRF